jgi:hypothetical protein
VALPLGGGRQTNDVHQPWAGQGYKEIVEVRTLFLLPLLLLFSLGCSDGKRDWGGLVGPDGGGPDAGEPELFPKSYASFEEVPLPPFRPPNPDDPDSDVDCDGIPDWEEMERVYPSGLKTDPLNRDTDGEIGRAHV